MAAFSAPTFSEPLPGMRVQSISPPTTSKAARDHHAARVSIGAVLTSAGLALIATASMGIYLYHKYRALHVLVRTTQQSPSGKVFDAAVLQKSALSQLAASPYVNAVSMVLGVACVTVGTMHMARHARAPGGNTQGLRSAYSMGGMAEDRAAKGLLLAAGVALGASSTLAILLHVNWAPLLDWGRSIGKEFPIESEFAQLPSDRLETDLYRAQLAMASLSMVYSVVGIVALAGKHLNKRARAVDRAHRAAFMQ